MSANMLKIKEVFNLSYPYLISLDYFNALKILLYK